MPISRIGVSVTVPSACLRLQRLRSRIIRRRCSTARRKSFWKEP